MFLNKISMIIIEVLTTIGTVVKFEDIYRDFGGEKTIMIIVLLVVSVLITLSSPEEDR